MRGKVTARQLTADTHELWIGPLGGQGNTLPIGTAKQVDSAIWHVSLRSKGGPLQPNVIEGTIEVHAPDIKGVVAFMEQRFMEFTRRHDNQLSPHRMSEVLLTTLLSFNVMASDTGTMDGFLRAIAMTLGVVLDEDVPPEGHAQMWADLKREAERYAIESAQTKRKG